ncbi:MAG: glycosyltransferase [candidate division WOR-3 bacterium]|nr:MAG: glycosyltransferase [candidate division WOR-3 bacterium]
MPQPRIPGLELPRLSVLIAAFNEERLIAGKLRNTLALNYPDDRLEVIVGSDGSTDATDEIVRNLARDDSRIRLVRSQSRIGYTGIHNLMLENSSGELLMITDADISLAANTATYLAAWFSNPAVGAAMAHLIRTDGQGSPAEGIFDRLEERTRRLEGKMGALVGTYAAALMLRRALASPLPSDTILADFAIGIRPLLAGRAVVYEPRAKAYGMVETPALELRRRIRIAAGSAQAFMRYALPVLARRGPAALALASHKLARALMPVLLVLILIGSVLGCFSVGMTGTISKALVLLLASSPLALTVRPRLRRLLLVQYYVLANAATLYGYVKYFLGQQRHIWQRTPRTGGGQRITDTDQAEEAKGAA